MPNLKFYDSERVEFYDEYSLSLTPLNAVKIIKKLVRHYELPSLMVTFNIRKKGKAVYYTSKRSNKQWIGICPYGVNLGVIIHEVAHHYQFIKTGKTRHSKKLMSVIRRVIKYCRKMNYWGMNE